MRVLAIDPGNTESAYVIIDADRRPIEFEKIGNHALRGRLLSLTQVTGLTVIEMVASYGMAVGAEVFETCVWIGRFQEAGYRATFNLPELVTRAPVKLHHCHSRKAKDSNIVQALVDRFTPGERNFGKGTKAEPGWFHGFSRDVWQAYALAVYAMDRDEGLAA